MRFWYPISALGRPSPGLARSSSLVLYSEDRTCAEIYCELLRNEACLTRMYCRETCARLLARKAESQSQITGLGNRMTKNFAKLMKLSFFPLSCIVMSVEPN